MAYISSYSNVTTATIPKDSWDEAWLVVASWKGYLQSFPGFGGVRASGRALDNGDVRFQVATSWEYPEQLEEWHASPWSAVNLLMALKRPAYDVVTETFEDLS